MPRKKRKRCPWCPNVNGCSGCSITGDDPDNYILVPKSISDAKLKKALAEADEEKRLIIQRWAMLTSVLVGGTVAVLMLLAFAVS